MSYLSVKNTSMCTDRLVNALIVIYAGVCVHDGGGCNFTILFTLYIFETFLKTFFMYGKQPKQFKKFTYKKRKYYTN